MEDAFKISLRAARVNAGMTLVDAAKALGRTRQTVSSWETGKTEPKASDLQNLCDLYGVPVEHIFLPAK